MTGLSTLSPERVSEVRLECARMANQLILDGRAGQGVTPHMVIAYARDLADFVLGTNDAEILRAARSLADWALANPDDAARVATMLAKHPGGMCEVYLPLLKSTPGAEVRRVGPDVAQSISAVDVGGFREKAAAHGAGLVCEIWTRVPGETEEEWSSRVRQDAPDFWDYWMSLVLGVELDLPKYARATPVEQA